MNIDDADKLLHWYQRRKRALPWRQTLDPYSVMVSEFMLQQTTVAAVIPKYHQWMARFPDITSLATAEEAEVMRYWSGLGYYQRAKRLHRVARQLAELGSVPDSYQELLDLPGFGPYTAAAVASICFERPHLAIDTNVIRVLFRYLALARPAGDTQAKKLLEDCTREVLNLRDPGEFNQALMELGASVCDIRNPDCGNCPIRKGCKGRVSPAGPTAFPLPKPKKVARKTLGAGFLLTNEDDSRYLLVKGTSLGLLGLLYQPPIHFIDEPISDEFAGMSDLLGSELEDYVADSQWEIKYGISGRKLQLRCKRWRLPDSALDDLSNNLASAGLNPTFWEPTALHGPAVSSLTRKILERAPETR